MKRFPLLVMASMITALAQDAAPKHEIGLTLGGLLKQDRSGASTSLELGTGTAFQANYARRLVQGKNMALYGEIHFLANPLREIASASRTLTRDVATIYATPGVKLKFFPGSRITPFVAAGGGYSLYENSDLRIDGQPNQADRFSHGGVFTYGGGVDFKVWKFIALRGEIRDFYSGSPGFNTSQISGRQHNIVAGGGFVVRFQ